jgi:tetratricopeptide (TPR) repeat protein
MQRQSQSIQRAIEYHRAAIELDPKFALAYAGLASAYMSHYYYADFSLADTAGLVRENVEKALAIDPELAEAFVARGLLHLESFELAAAEQDFRRAIALKASYPEAYQGLGMVHEYRGEAQLALPVYDQAATLDPLHLGLNGRRCLTLQNLGRYAESARACNRLVELQPKAATAYWGPALLELAQGNTEKAIRGYRAALERTPERPDMRAELAWLYLDLGMPDDADAAYPRLPAASSDFLGLELERARASVASRDAEALARHLDSLPLAANASPRQLIEAALMQLVAGRVHDAEALCERARSDPRLSETATIEQPWLTRWGRSDGVTLAAVALASGNRLEAERYLDATQQWIDRVDRNGQVWYGTHYLRAEVLALRGKPDAAMKSLRRARELGWRSAWWARADPALASLRERADFRALLDEVEAINAAARARLAADLT